MQSTLLLLIALCALPICSTPVQPQLIPKALADSFDDIPPSDLTTNKPVPSPYNNLVFGTFNVRTDAVSVVRAHSPPNSISSNGLTNTLNGGVIASIYSNYTGSKVSNFDLKETYLGCAITAQGVKVSVPQACTIQFQGTKPDGSTVSGQGTYGGTELQPALVPCSLSAIRGVKYVALVPAKTMTLPTTTVIILDNINGTIYLSS